MVRATVRATVKVSVRMRARAMVKVCTMAGRQGRQQRLSQTRLILGSLEEGSTFHPYHGVGGQDGSRVHWGGWWCHVGPPLVRAQ